MTNTYLLHLYHPSGPCKRYLFHSRVQAMKMAQAWLKQHFADRQEQCLRDIMKETDYFNPVYLARLDEDVPDDARFLIRLASSGASFPTSEEQAWEQIDAYAIAHACPREALGELHSYLREQNYEPQLRILFYPLTIVHPAD